ncbi:hypothetical protein JNB63_04395 [Microbacterium trichothecenolyticum]|uniref:hypothetical protein n=1 Tax=Microbacterium trichothecenolyticum TaxID=69370 RepID=UPI001C6E4C16|nr:hypothetical protein [Microbacterium trichothecenolyticum]MBW9119324.1 hypothetical protein [Microbacterium trichothecenolyticum]
MSAIEDAFKANKIPNDTVATPTTINSEGTLGTARRYRVDRTEADRLVAASTTRV